jgi:TrmH family RNA methyltransferase
MISKIKSKFIISLQKKKIRDEKQLFIIEGDKIVKEFLAAGIKVKMLIARPEFLSTLPAGLTRFADEIEEVSFEELKQVSTLVSPHDALAVIPMPVPKMDTAEIFNQLSVSLDCIQDPGNLGTIIRAAGWFGIKNIICSPDCVDVYNPKVIQASMGALLHVNVCYTDLRIFLSSASKSDIPVFGTLLEGDSIYSHKLDNKGIILLGNESKGISDELLPFITEKITIPGFSNAKHGIDSLNVGMAASVVLSEFARRGI